MKKIILLCIAFLIIFGISCYAMTPMQSISAPNNQIFNTTIQEITFNLMYHRISPDENLQNDFTITPKQFEDDIAYLISKGYQFFTAKELSYATSVLPANKIAVITFDDGYASDYLYALPILEKYNAKATFFVVGSLIDTEGYMTSEQLKLLSQSPYAEIGNHSYINHSYLPEEITDVYTNSTYKAMSDFETNARFISKIIGKPVTAISYPYGVYNKVMDYSFKSRKYTRFCSDEAWYQDTLQPLVRFNRSNLRSAQNIYELLYESN